MSATASDKADFVSSTQLEVTEQREVIRTVDFATASTWLMKRKTFDTVGAFDESFRIHHDNEWLPAGHTSRTEIRRLGLDPNVLRAEADAIAEALVAALGGTCQPREAGG